MKESPPQHLPVRPARGGAIALVVLLVLGIAAGIYLFGTRGAALLTLGPWGMPALFLFVVTVAAIAAMPPTAAQIARLLSFIREPSVLGRRCLTVLAAVVTSGFLSQAASAGHRQLWPYVHDEFSYMVQAHQFASGHLWMPAHPLAPFFDSFQLFPVPVYASAYFPGTALLYVPGIWLHLPAWVTSIAIAGAIGGLLYRIATELVDGIAGWLAVLLLWADRVFRSLSTMTLAQVPLLLFGMLAIWSWLKWSRHRRRRWAIGIGIFSGLAAVTRPVDALCFIVPIGIAMAIELFCRDTGLRPVRETSDFTGNATSKISSRPHGPEVRVTVGLWVIAGMMPLLVFQLVLNRGITGHLFETPFRLYADRDYPGTAYGFHAIDAMAKPASDLPQKLSLYREYVPLIQRHRPWPALLETLRFRLPLTLTQGTPAPFPLLLPLLPVALLGLTRPRGIVLASLPIFLLLYFGYVFFFSHYTMTAAPAVILAILVGADQFSITLARKRRFFQVFWTLLIAGLAIAAFPQWDGSTNDDQFDAPLIADVNRQLPAAPALVLFTYDPARNTNEEPVFNADVACPDDAPVIRAHDLGPRNLELFRYYAQRQPDRMVYRYDERTRKLVKLGLVTVLAKQSP